MNKFRKRIDKLKKIQLLLQRKMYPFFHNKHPLFRNNGYLLKLFKEKALAYNINALNFNLINDQNLVVLNELESISLALVSALNAFKKDGGNILTIPSNNISLNIYNQLFNVNNLSNFVDGIYSTKRVTSINYDHPLLLNSFYTKVTNFQYPRVNSSFRFSSNTGGVLSYDDGSIFLQGKNGSYAWT